MAAEASVKKIYDNQVLSNTADPGLTKAARNFEL